MAVFLFSYTEDIMYMSISIFYAAGVGVVATLYLMSVVLYTKKAISTTLVISIIPLIVLAIATLLPHTIITEAYIQDKTHVVVNVFGYFLYTLLFTIYYGASLIYLLLTALREPRHTIARRQVFSLFWAFLSSGGISLMFDIVIPFFGIYDYIALGPFSLIIFLGILIFATIQYRLFDFRSGIINLVGYVVALITVVGVFLCGVSIFDIFFLGGFNEDVIVNARTGYIVIAIICMGIFTPIKHVVDRHIECVFYGSRYKISDFIKDLGVVVSTSIEMNSTLRRTAHVIQQRLKARYVFYIMNSDNVNDAYGTAHMPQLNDKEIDEILLVSKRLRQAEYVAPVVNFGAIHTHAHDRLIKDKDIAFMLPIIQNKQHIGVLVVGVRESGEYSSRDLLALRTIASEIAITVQNMLSVIEINSMNEHLEQRVKDATVRLRRSNQRLREIDTRKDEFMSMASHNLRTPLTSIKGYVSGVLEGDAGEINDLQRMMLEQAFNSSNRMVHLVGDLLNLSRIQNGKFMIVEGEVHLGEVVKEEVEGMRQIAESHQITLNTHIDTKVPSFIGDVSKLRQVIMNLIDNAIFYSHKGDSVMITLTHNKKQVEFTVIDQGIGVPDTARDTLFSKFNRAENAKKQRPDGTGIGLYMAKQVVDLHNGEMIFESVEGQGSTFGFRLPLTSKSKKASQNIKNVV